MAAVALGPASSKEEEEVKLALEEIRLEMEAKCAEIRAEARRMASSIKNNFGVEIMKIPKKIRSMSVTEFMTECGGDISTVLARNRQRALAARNASGKAGAAAATTRKARTGRSGIAAGGATVKRARVGRSALPSTPGGRVRGPMATPTGSKALHVAGPPCTPALRLPRKGEAILSVRGSPLGSFASAQVVLAQKAASQAAGTPADSTAASSAAAISLTLEAAGGSTVELKDAQSAADLSHAEKAEAATKIASLQAQLSELMSALS